MQINKFNNYFEGILYFIILIYFIVLFFQVKDSSIHILTDAANYTMGAENIAKGNGFTAYNVGYLENEEINDYKVLVPITRYQPLFSFFVSLLINLGFSALPAARFINLIFYAVFIISWLMLFKHIFAETKYFILASLFLVFSSGIFSYILPPHSEMVFIGLLGILGNLIFLSHNSYSKKQQFIYILLAGIFSGLLILTRYAGIAFVLSTGITIFLISIRCNFRKAFINLMIFSAAFFITVFWWFYRNIRIQGSATSRYPDNYTGTLFDFDRIFEILNLFFTSSLGLPKSLENYLSLLLIPVLLIVGLLLYYKFFSRNIMNYWFWFSIIIYVGMIVYMGIWNRAVNREIGFMRFFYLTQPFLIGILIFMLQSLSYFKKNSLALLSKIFIVGLLSFSLLSGINRTRIFFQFIPAKENKENIVVYNHIKKIASKNDLILSNEWQNISARTLLPIVQIHFEKDIDSLRTKYKGKYNEVFIVLMKDVGITYRKGVDTWRELIANKNMLIISETNDLLFCILK